VNTLKKYYLDLVLNILNNTSGCGRLLKREAQTLPKRWTGKSLTCKSLAPEMISPIRKARAKFKTHAEMSLRQRLTVDHTDALAKLASQGSQTRMFFSAPEAHCEQAGAMRTDAYGDGLPGDEQRLIEH